MKNQYIKIAPCIISWPHIETWLLWGTQAEEDCGTKGFHVINYDDCREHQTPSFYRNLPTETWWKWISLFWFRYKEPLHEIYRAAFISGLAHQHVCICMCIVIISFITTADASVCYRSLAAGKELLLGDVLHCFFFGSVRNHLVHASALIIR